MPSVRSTRKDIVDAGEHLTKAVHKLDKAIERLPDQFDSVLNPMKSLWLTFLKGIMYGLGILVAAVIVIPLLITILQFTVDWVPLTGDFLLRVVERMEDQVGSRP